MRGKNESRACLRGGDGSRGRHWAVSWVLLALCATALPPARADIVLLDHESRLSAVGQATEFQFNPFRQTAVDRDEEVKTETTGFAPFNETVAAAASVPTGSASAGAVQNTSFTFNAADDTLFVTSIAALTAETTPQPSIRRASAAGNANSNFVFHFDLTDHSYRYQIGESLSVSRAVPDQLSFFSSLSSARVTLRGFNVDVQRIEDASNGATSIGSLTGILEPGQYQVGVRAQAFSSYGAFAESVHNEADAALSFSLSLTPASRWIEPAGGSFQGISNWSAAVPGAQDVAVFDLPGTYTVTLEQDVTNKVLLANGAGVNVSFDLKGFDYVLDEISIGGLAGDNASITFADSNPPVVVAVAAVAPGGLAQAAANNPAAQLRAGLLTARKGGIANVKIPISSTLGTIDFTGRVNVKGANGRWDVTLLTMGEEDQGTLEISAGGKVVSDRAVVGANLINTISVATVTGQDSVWNNDTLLVGEGGLGHLIISNKAIVAGREIVIGSVAGSIGRISVSNSASLVQNSTDKLTIGLGGEGRLDVASESIVTAGDLTIGGSSTADGEVVVENAGQLLVIGTLSVGAGGNAILRVNGGRVARTGSGGSSVISSTNELQVNAGHFYERHLLKVNGVMSIHPTLGSASVGQIPLEDPGRLTLGPGGTLSGNGIIRGSLDELPGSVRNFGGQFLPGTSPGTFTIDGDYEQIGGLLGIEIAGTAPGQFDVLAVTGSATLGGTLRLEFIDDFAPRQGDEFKFLDIGGALSGAFANIEVRNLMPGFQFDFRPDGGGLTMVALNDGVFVPEPATLAMLLAGMLATLFRRGGTGPVGRL